MSTKCVQSVKCNHFRFSTSSWCTWFRPRHRRVVGAPRSALGSSTALSRGTNAEHQSKWSTRVLSSTGTRLLVIFAFHKTAFVGDFPVFASCFGTSSSDLPSFILECFRQSFGEAFLRELLRGQRSGSQVLLSTSTKFQSQFTAAKRSGAHFFIF